jgi:hypothetical protein
MTKAINLPTIDFSTNKELETVNKNTNFDYGIDVSYLYCQQVEPTENKNQQIWDENQSHNILKEDNRNTSKINSKDFFKNIQSNISFKLMCSNLNNYGKHSLLHNKKKSQTECPTCNLINNFFKKY